MYIEPKYRPLLANWPRKAGKRPLVRHFRGAYSLARPGSKNALALAMALREQGATQPQIMLVTGIPHRNIIKKVILDKKVKAKIKTQDGRKVVKLSLN